MSSGGWGGSERDSFRISVLYLKPKPRFADLKVSEDQYQKRIEGDKEDLISYRDDSRGVVFVVDKNDGLLNSVRYLPSANDDHLKCPDSGERLAASETAESLMSIQISHRLNDPDA